MLIHNGKQLQIFVMQILHNPVVLTAMDLFSIDLTIVPKVLLSEMFSLLYHYLNFTLFN